MKVNLAVVVLTYNEELNISHCLRCVVGWASQVFVVDSFSRDSTVEISERSGATVFQNPWDHWATQRNWALDNLPLQSDWVLFLDADEELTPELAVSIQEALESVPAQVAGFYLNRNFFFLGQWIRWGGYSPNWILRLVRRRGTRIIKAGDREYFSVTGETRRIVRGALLHKDRRGVADWIQKHNTISSLATERSALEVRPEGSLEGRTRTWLRDNVAERIPLLLQPWIFFGYRYFFRLGVLDGRAGFVYHFLHDFWYPLLISAKKMEKRPRVDPY